MKRSAKTNRSVLFTRSRYGEAFDTEVILVRVFCLFFASEIRFASS